MNEIWDVIFQQNKAKEILTNIYNSRRVPHAFIFSGLDGVGKFQTAIQFAKLLNTEMEENSNNENIYKKISSLQEPYVKLIVPLPRGKNETGEDTATEKLSSSVLESIHEQLKKKSSNPYFKISIDGANTIKINSIRDIKKFITLSENEVKYRLIIINDAHLMNEQAQNSLLKNLEEPPEGIIFVLITNQKERLLQTILSRCWTLDFEPLSEDSVSQILTTYFNIPTEVAKEGARFSEGSVQTALALIAQLNLKEIQNHTISFLRFALAKRYNSAALELRTFLDKSDDTSLYVLIRMIKMWLNDVMKNKVHLEGYYFEDYRDTLDKFNMRYSKSNLTQIYSILDNLENYREKNVNLNVLSLNLIFEIASLTIWN